MRTCSNCGAPLEEGAQFCTECGTRVCATQRQCPYCGAAIDDDSQFCSECGAKLDGVPADIPHVQTSVAVQQPQQSVTEFTQTQSGSDNIVVEAKKKSNPWIYAIAGVFVVILLALGGKYLLDKNDNGDELEMEQTEIVHLSMSGSVDKYPITMQLNIEGSTVKGHYYYDKQGPDKVLTLEGVKNTDNRLYLDEFDEYGEKSGTFIGSLLNGIFEGEFVTAKGKSLYFHVSETR